MAWTYLGKIIREGRSWASADGVTHPASWGGWSDDEKKAAGLVWKDDPAPFDSRFWWDAETPKSLDDVVETLEGGEQATTLGLKSVWKNVVKDQAIGLLSKTDWYVTRQAETGKAMPKDVADYRAAVRAASDAINDAIDSAADHAAFVALFDAPDGENGNPPIFNWPKA